MTPTGTNSRLLLIALGAAALFTVESWALGPYSWMYGYGAGLETLPTHLALLHDGRLFSPWAPFVGSGVDRFAFWGNADPLNLETVFVALLPPWLANGLHRFVQYFIAIFFTAKLCEEQLALERRPAVLAGVLYACFSYFTFGEMLALPALPLFLWLMQRIRATKRGWWLPLVAGLGFSTLTTFTHSVPYFALFAALWSAIVLRDVSWRAAANLALLVVGLTLGDFPQLLAALATASLSHREGFPPERVDWSLDGLLYRQLRFDYFNQDPLAKFVAWDLPLPLLTVGAILAALARTPAGRPRLGLAYLRVYAVYLLLSQRWLFVGAQNVIGEWLPWVRGIYMGRFFDVPASLLIACQLALLVSLARTKLETARWPQRLITVAVAVLVLFMLLRPKIYLFYPIGVDGWGQMNYQVQSLDRLMRAETEPFRVASVLPLQPAYAYAQGLEAADGWANLYPKAYRQYWLHVLAPLLRNVPRTKEIFDPESGRPQDHYIFLGADLAHPGYGLLPGEDPARAVVEGFDVDQRFDLKLLGLHNVKYLLSELPLKSRSLNLVHAPADPPRVAQSRDWATGLKSPPSRAHGSNLWRKSSNALSNLVEANRRKALGKDLFIYRLSTYLPRFRFVEELRPAPSGPSLLASLVTLSAEELARSALAEQADVGDGDNLRFVVGQINSKQVHSDKITLAVNCSADAFLVVGITWNPHWRAEIDGKATSLIRVNHVQMGLKIPAGSTHVRLRYVAIWQ